MTVTLTVAIGTGLDVRINPTIRYPDPGTH